MSEQRQLRTLVEDLVVSNDELDRRADGRGSVTGVLGTGLRNVSVEDNLKAGSAMSAPAFLRRSEIWKTRVLWRSEFFVSVDSMPRCQHAFSYVIHLHGPRTINHDQP